MKIRQSQGHTIAVVSWEDLGSYLRRIAEDIRRSGFNPDVIVGILRGGSILAVWLSHLVGVPDVETLSIRTTVSDEVRAARRSPLVDRMPPAASVAGKRVLIVDDVVNTGQTLLAARKSISDLGILEARLAVAVRDIVTDIPAVVPDYWAVEVAGWIVFPWEPEPE